VAEHRADAVSTPLRAALAGHYEILREIGRGGMATVYLARDVKHARDVAVKVLDPELGAVLGVERFLSEIRVTATLQHPNLLPLFDSGEAHGLLFYVMPFVDGESLRARLDREKQLSVDDAVRIATAVANALTYAHERGVIHRDLKPENILLQAGQPVVADFGIALAVSNAAGQRVTQTGLSLGTPQYMSPEQATGDRDVDRRTDIYSLAAVTYEMLAGEPPHSGPTVQAVIAKLMTEDVRPIAAVRRSVPAHVDQALARGLEKLAADRFATATEFADVLNGRVTTPQMRRPGTIAAASRSRGVAMIAIAAVAGIVLGAAAVALLRPTALEEPLRRLSLLPPPGLTFESIAFSPDGRRIAFAAADSAGRSRLWVRSLDSTDATPIADTDGASDPFWSPDSRSLGFFAGKTLKRVDVAGGAPQTLCAVPFNRGGSRGGTWGPNDTIVFAAFEWHWSALHAVSARGGEPRTLDTREPSSTEGHHWWPSFLPDGRHFLYYVSSARADMTGIYLGSLDGAPGRMLLRAPTAGIPVSFSPAGSDVAMLYVEAGTLLMRRLELSGATLSPDAVPLGAVVADAQAHHAIVTASKTGQVLYASRVGRTRFHWLDRRGVDLGAVGEPGIHIDLKIAPDDRRAVVQRENARAKGDLYLLGGSTEVQITEGDEYHGGPTLSGDGTRLFYFVVPARGRWEIRQRAMSGAGAEQLVHRADVDIVPLDVSPDERALMYLAFTTGENASDLWTWSVANGGRAEPFLATSSDETLGRFSPNGRWVAFQSNRSGQYEIWILPFPAGAADPIRVSVRGGTQPRWPRQGHELFYIDGDNRLMAVEVSTAGGFRASTPSPLFRIRPSGVDSYDVTLDGQRFLVAIPEDEASSKPATVVLNWPVAMRR